MTKDEKAPEESQEAVKSVENLQEESQKEISDIANEVAALANRLVHKTEFNRLIGGMLASRRLYQMCLYELDLLCDETDFKKASRIEGEENLDVQKTLPPERLAFLKEVLINSAAIEAQKPFNENDLFQQMATTVFPWMQEIVVKHNEQERKEQRKGFEEAYLKRIATPVSFGVRFEDAGQDNSGFELNRKQSVCFVGEQKVVHWLLDRISETATGNNEHNVKQVLRLYSSQGKPKVTDDKVWNIPENAWKESAETNNSFMRVYESQALPNLSNPPDLLIVDNLSHASKGLSISSLTTRANDAQRKFKKWSESVGCLLIGCIVLPRPLKANELMIPEYETLKMHNLLRGVATEQVDVDGSPHYKVFVGKYEYAVVPVSHIDEYEPRTIVEA